jgi:hypothetical protein
MISGVAEHEQRTKALSQSLIALRMNLVFTKPRLPKSDLDL